MFQLPTFLSSHIQVFHQRPLHVPQDPRTSSNPLVVLA